MLDEKRKPKNVLDIKSIYNMIPENSAQYMNVVKNIYDIHIDL